LFGPKNVPEAFGSDVISPSYDRTMEIAMPGKAKKQTGEFIERGYAAGASGVFD
jgi:hypothetical protein